MMRSGPRGFHPGSGASSSRRHWALLMPALAALGILLVLYGVSRRLSDQVATVVVYTSQDQVYSEPILAEFERASGIRVQALYDSEAVKTVGLVNRLLAEQAHPRCDVFWNNEELRTRQLVARGVLEPTWAALGHRSRRLVINTNVLALDQAPRSLLELTNEVWRGRVAMAYPLFGTTATHFLALRQHWGEEGWRRWCEALKANDTLVVDGNSVVVRLVGQGQAMVGLTDSDDVAAGMREGYPLQAQPLGEDSLLIPNTVALVRGAPHPEPAAKLMAFLQDPTTIGRLVEANALESVAAPVESQRLQPNWTLLLEQLEPGTDYLKRVFLR